MATVGPIKTKWIIPWNPTKSHQIILWNPTRNPTRNPLFRCFLDPSRQDPAWSIYMATVPPDWRRFSEQGRIFRAGTPFLNGISPWNLYGVVFTAKNRDWKPSIFRPTFWGFSCDFSITMLWRVAKSRSTWDVAYQARDRPLTGAGFRKLPQHNW